VGPMTPRLRRAAALAALAVPLSLAVPAGPAAAVASALYVDVNHPQCSDSGSGTQTTPFCSIGPAAQVAVAGQTVLISSGTYVEEVVPVNSGTSGSPITYKAAPGAQVTVTGGNRGFAVRSKSWITIEGLTVTKTADNGIYLKSSSNMVVRNNWVSYAGKQVSGLTAQGIYVVGTANAQIVDNVVHNNSDTGIYVTTGNSGIEVRNNESFANARGFVRAATGIDIRSPGNTVRNNRSYNNEDSGIQLYNGATGTVVSNNLTYGNGDHGIDVLNSTDVVVVANTVYNNVTAGINFEGSTGTPASSRGTVRNNITVDNGLQSTTTRGNIRVDAKSLSGTTLDYDLMNLSSTGTMITWGTTAYSSLAAFRNAIGQEQQGIQDDPRWVAPGSADFHLRSGSLAIDSADSGAPGQPATDFDGVARVDDPATPNTGAGVRTYDDRGALEHVPGPVASLTVTPSDGPAPLAVTADASGSTAPSGISSYTFDWGDGTPVTGPQAGPTATHTFLTPGIFTVTVTVVAGDGRTASASASAHARALDEPPDAALTVTPTSGPAPLAVTADASASSDNDATPIRDFTFDFGDGTVVGPQTGATADHTYPNPGAYTVTVTVTDTGDKSSTASTTVTVDDPNLVANPGFETSTSGWNTSGRAGVTLTRVSGGRSGSWSAELANTNTTTVSDCTLNDAPNTVGSTQSGTYRASVWVRGDAAGAVVRLRLREYNGGAFVASSPVASVTLGTGWTQLSTDITPQVVGSNLDLTVYVTGAAPGTCFYADDVRLARNPPPSEQPPSARLTVTPSSGQAPLAVTADASASTDTDATPIRDYTFDFGDGTLVGPQAGATATHTYAARGEFTVTVTVTDTGGLSSTATAPVSVTDANLVTNPGFETDAKGWNTSGRAGVTLTRVSGGRSGDWSAQLANTNATSVPDCTLNDAPNTVSSSQPGVYRASVWVRGDVAGNVVRLRVREYNGGTFVSASPIATVTVGTSWTELTTDITPQVAGSNLDLTVYVTSAAPGTCFYADDVSLIKQ